MTPTAQRTAIAEACGWTVEEGTTVGHAPNGAFLCDIPDYLTDLNAMHEAEKVLAEEHHHCYRFTLANLVEPMHGTDILWSRAYISATAAQRAEAFLRTLGKWEEAT